MNNNYHHAKIQRQSLIENRYLARLAGAGAMWVEMQTLLGYDLTGKTRPEIQHLVIEENILAKHALANRQEVWKKLRGRYLLDTEHPVFCYFLDGYYAETGESQRALLAYLLLTANDALVRRIGRDWLAPQFARPGKVLKHEDLGTFLAELTREQPSLKDWTDTTRKRFIQHYLGAVRDFGLAEGKVRKKVSRPHVGSRAMIFAAQLSMLQGLKPLEMLYSDWFRLLGLDLNTTISKLYQLNAEGLARFRMQGDVVEFSLLANQEVFHGTQPY